MTHSGQKGFGMTKHGRSGHATRSPRFRFLQKLEAQKNDRKDRSRIKDPKQSVDEVFHPRKPTWTWRTDWIGSTSVAGWRTDFVRTVRDFRAWPDSDITGYNAAAHPRVLRSSTSLRARRMRQL